MRGERKSRSLPAAVSQVPKVTSHLFRLLMLVFVDTSADAVLLAIDPSLFRLGEMTIVLCHILLFAILHAGLALFQVGGLVRAQLAIFQSIPDTLLLVRFALIDFIDARMAGVNDAGASA